MNTSNTSFKSPDLLAFIVCTLSSAHLREKINTITRRLTLSRYFQFIRRFIFSENYSTFIEFDSFFFFLI